MALSAFTGLGSKFGGLALQLLALPLVVRALGTEDFAIFAISNSILAFLAITNLGIESHLVVSISGALKKSKNRVSANISHALMILTIVGMVILIGAYAAHEKDAFSKLLGEIYTNKPKESVQLIFIVITLGILQQFNSVFVAAQNAYQELYFNNLFSGFGSLFAAGSVAVYFLAAAEHSIIWFILLFYLPTIFAQSAAAAHFLHRHEEARPQFKHIDPLLFRSLLVGGLSFIAAQSVLPMAIREVPKFTLAHRGDFDAATTYSLLIVLLTSLGGIILAFTQPMYGALSEAYAKGDFAWMKKRVFQFSLVFIAIGLGAGAFGFFFGERLTSLWVGKENTIGRETVATFGVYFGVNCIFHILTLGMLSARSSLPATTINLVTAGSFVTILSLLKDMGVTSIFLAAIFSVTVFGIFPTAIILKRKLPHRIAG